MSRPSARRGVEHWRTRVASDRPSCSRICLEPALIEGVVTQLDAIAGLSAKQVTVAEAGERLKALKAAVARHEDLRKSAGAAGS